MTASALFALAAWALGSTAALAWLVRLVRSAR